MLDGDGLCTVELEEKIRGVHMVFTDENVGKILCDCSIPKEIEILSLRMTLLNNFVVFPQNQRNHRGEKVCGRL